MRLPLPMRPLAALFSVALTLFASSVALSRGFELVSTAGLGDELTCLGMDHRDPNFVMIGTTHGKIMRTEDGGATWQEVTVTPFRSLFFGRERHDDPRLEYALGLPGKSPHLQSWLRSKGLHTAGINLQQLLVKHGDKAVSINWIEVDWHNRNRVYVGTIDGLYRSLDRGRTFVRIWQGRANMSERVVNTVVTDPAEAGRLIVGTAQGLFLSTNHGATLKREMDFYIRNSYIRQMWFDRQQRGLVHMAMGGAAMASPDSGRSWITTHWDLWGPRSDVQWISLGPNNIRAIATRDGIWASWQGGEMQTWKRRGYRFVGKHMVNVLITQQANVWYATNDEAVWITEDYGNNWRKVMQLGQAEHPRWLEAYAANPANMWLLTNRHAYRYGGVPQLKRRHRLSAKQRKRYVKLLDMPDLHEFWRRVVKHKHVYFKDVQRYRDRAPWAGLMPEIRVSGTYGRSQETELIRSFPYLSFPYTYFNDRRELEPSVEIYAVWDISRLIFDRRQLPHFGRIDRALQEVRRDITQRVHRLYDEYRIVAQRLAFGRSTSPFAAELERIRLQEIAGFFDAISHDYWTKATGGVP